MKKNLRTNRAGLRPVPIFISILLFVIIFQKALEGLFFSSKSTPLDEVAIALITIIALSYQAIKGSGKIQFVIIFIFSVYLVVISLLFGENGSAFAIFFQTFLYLQFFLLTLSLWVISEAHKNFIFRTLVTAVIVSFLGLLFQVIFPITFSQVFGVTDYVLSFNGASPMRVEGFQKNPNSLGILFSLFAVLLMLKRDIIKGNLLRSGLIIIAIITVVASGSRSALIYLLIGFLFCEIPLRKKMITLVVAGTIAVSTGYSDSTYEKTASNLEHVQAVTETKYIRWLMTYYGTMLAVENFPIGTGAGTFGSAFSHQSAVYKRVGLADLASVQEGRGIHDSNYGSIAGEFGVIGLTFFFGLGFYLINSLFRSKGTNAKPLKLESKAFYRSIIAIFLISPFLRPLFSSSYYGAIVVMVALGYIECFRERGVLSGRKARFNR